MGHDTAVEAAFADVNGTRLYYEARGAGPALLFLHGFTLDRRMWSRQVEVLAASHRVVAYDARGFGQSALPSSEPYRHCDDAAALCEHLGLRNVTVVGQSIGAHQMLELAIARPDLVAGYVGVAPSGLATVAFPSEVIAMFAAIREAARTHTLDEAKALWSHGGWFAPAREDLLLARELDAMLADYSGWHWTHPNPAKNLEPPASERLAALRIPALLIHGERDLPYNDEVSRALAHGLAGAKLLRLPRASHMANMEDPDTVNRAIAELAARAAQR
ncbi:MAG TPA: alpha/beta hydrolase [Polyangiaceae bacterium]|jgi:pimeloyl-ACP methyl ester carboxylesterase